MLDSYYRKLFATHLPTTLPTIERSDGQTDGVESQYDS
jgi:hypothetical protein